MTEEIDSLGLLSLILLSRLKYMHHALSDM